MTGSLKQMDQKKKKNGYSYQSGRSPGERSGNALQYSCLGNPMNIGVWWATVHGGAKESDMTKQTAYMNHMVITN